MHRNELAQILDTYRPLDVEKPDVLDRFGQLLALDGDVFHRSHFDPGHVTSSAVVLSADRSQMALIHHRKLQRWLQPGGHVERADPDLVAAAAREAVEECGPLRLRALGLIDLDVHPIPGFGSEPPHLHFDVRLAFIGEGELLGSDEVTDARWFSIDDPPADTDESVRRLFRKAALIG